MTMESFRKQPLWIKVVIILGGSLLVAIGINVLGIRNPGEAMQEDCTFPFAARINCLNYEVSRNGLDLGLQNGIGRDVIVSEVMALSYAIEGGKCTTGMIDRPLRNGDLGTFVLNDPRGGGCIYRETGRQMNFYEIEIAYSYEERGVERTYKAAGDLRVLPPPGE